ncbi:MAG: flagellar filament capping protein FliD [Leptospirales bacterium]|nr:flagellar filament capping protein FliD [Leptospirales bacterium]
MYISGFTRGEMMPVTMGGAASGIDTDSIIQKLVEAESKPIKQFQKDKYLNSQKKEALNMLSASLKDLDSKAKDLYGFRASFSEKSTISSDDTAVEAIASRQADIGSKKIEVLQLASNHKISTDMIDPEKKLTSGKITIEVNGVEKNINFKGGRLKSLNESIAEEASSIVSSDYVDSGSGTHMISLTSTVSGKKGEIKISGSDDLLKELGLVGGERIQSQSDSPIFFDRKFFTPHEIEGSQAAQTGTLEVGKDGKEIKISGFLWQEYELPIKEDIKSDTILKFDFTNKKELEEKVPSVLETGPEDEINVKGIRLKSYNISRIRPPQKQENLKIDSVSGVGVVSFDNGKREEKIYPLDGEAANKQEIPIGKDFNGKQISKIIFYNNDGETTFSEAMISSPIKTKDGFALKNTITEAANAKLKVDGLEIERDKNDGITDAIKGVTLNLKRKTENPVEIRISDDIDKPIQQVKAFVDSYNNYVELNRNLTKTVKIDKPGEGEKLEESGILVGDTTIIRLENSIKTTVGGAYPSREEKPIKMFSQMGVSSGKINSSWDSIKEGKLVIDEDLLRQTILENPEGVRSFFGSDTTGDNRIDNGMAYVLVRTLDPYISSGKNIIATRIDLEDESIKMTNEKIKKHEAYLKTYEEKLRQKFTAMEKSISGAKAQQEWMNNQMKGVNNEQ